MNNFTKSFEQQILEHQQLNEAPTEKEKLIARNTKFVLYAAFFIATFLYIAEQVCS